MAEGIASEEQLQRAIAAEQWYWSEGGRGGDAETDAHAARRNQRWAESEVTPYLSSIEWYYACWTSASNRDII